MTAAVPCAEPSVVLRLSDMLDKFGFDDGDALHDPVAQWALQSWPARLLRLDGLDSVADHPVWAYVDDRRLLRRLVAERVLPLLPSDLVLGHVGTARGVHNPLRAWPPRRWSASWQSYHELATSDAAVEVSIAEVFAACEETFPQRTMAWVELYDALTWQFALLESLPEQGPLELPADRALPLADSLHAQLADDGCLLLADLLRSRSIGSGVGSGIAGGYSPAALDSNGLRDLTRAVHLCLQG